MRIWTNAKWSLGILAAAGAWAIIDALASSHKRKHAQKDMVREVQEWENEGGASQPGAAGRS